MGSSITGINPGSSRGREVGIGCLSDRKALEQVIVPRGTESGLNPKGRKAVVLPNVYLPENKGFILE